MVRRLMDTKASTITALLGPTNTGKTHRAVQRMLEHRTGMIGLPLRLLAREVYDRVTLRIGENRVALVTGEEKRLPANPQYWVCTVEAMPVGRAVDFLAVDEIQLGAHRQRGHVFTDRILNARGLEETWLLGSDTMRPLLEQLVPTATVRSHPRLSTLRFSESQRLAALPPRSAIIAFSATEVYELADRVRRRRGGAAVVLGALSPRARNAQVAMFQAGEVDCLVATDAIGMGLNLDIDHVAFADLSKFDGRRRRALHPAELGQIAGRAGRHHRNGTFSTLAPLELAPSVALAVETQRFRPVRRLVWRNADLDFSSTDELVASLKQRPSRRCLQLVDRADDFGVLLRLLARPDIQDRARDPESLRLLWQVCQVPDFRKVLVEHHAPLLGEIFVQLSGPTGRLGRSWVAERVERLDNVSGSIEELMMRMESVRIWAYVSHQGGWLADAEAWQERTQEVEDRLSQALHERLVERFVESRTRGARHRTGGKRGRRPPQEPIGEVAPAGASPFHKLLELELALRPSVDPEPPGSRWVDQLVEARHDQFEVDGEGRVSFRPRREAEGDAEPVAQLVRGGDLLHPALRLVLERDTGAGTRARIERRLLAFVRDLVDETVAPLHDPKVRSLSAAARGLVYQLEQGLGTAWAAAAQAQIADLSTDDRGLLAALGVELGSLLLYLPAGLKPRAVERRVALCSAFHGRAVSAAAPAASTVSMPRRPRVPSAVYLAMGYPLLGARAVRADVAERARARLMESAGRGPFSLPKEAPSWLGCSRRQMPAVVRALGFVEADGRWRRQGATGRTRSA
ncbi:MAG: helicase [Deltaproteobacteria bacterium]|jgi:ATP-dependent RNA helicase SUPV3L1/SUV3|nr:helicase [Deltaproteobacteria bacterium]MBW2532676.1 helicase [Deltaproteobacteria bacterium]